MMISKRLFPGRWSAVAVVSLLSSERVRGPDKYSVLPGLAQPIFKVVQNGNKL